MAALRRREVDWRGGQLRLAAPSCAATWSAQASLLSIPPTALLQAAGRGQGGCLRCAAACLAAPHGRGAEPPPCHGLRARGLQARQHRDAVSEQRGAAAAGGKRLTGRSARQWQLTGLSDASRQPLLIKSRKCEPSCCCRCHLRCPAAGGIPHWRGHHEAGTARRWPGLPGPMVGEAGAALLCTMIACKGPACTASCSAQLLGQLLAGTLHAKDHQGANVSLQLCPQTAGPPASFVTAATAGRLASHRPRQWWTATAANQQVSICCGSMICRRALMWPLA